MRIKLDYFLLNSYLALIIPLAIYCLLLFQLNRRRHPVMISGIWDSIGLLFAASGFLLVTGPGLIGRHFEASMSEWIFVWICYYLLLVTGSVLLVWSRRDATVIYNVDADLLDQVLERVLGAESQVRLDVEPFPAMSNVTLYWRSGSRALRQEIVDELRRNLDECRSLDNPAAGWFLGISGMLFGFTLMVLLLMLWAYWQGP